MPNRLTTFFRGLFRKRQLAPKPSQLQSAHSAPVNELRDRAFQAGIKEKQEKVMEGIQRGRNTAEIEYLARNHSVRDTLNLAVRKLRQDVDRRVPGAKEKWIQYVNLSGSDPRAARELLLGRKSA